MKLFLLFVFALAALAREDRLSALLEKLIEERVAAESLVWGGKNGRAEEQLSQAFCGRCGCGGCGRRQLAREVRLSDVLEQLIEERVAETQLNDWGRHGRRY